MRTPTRLAAILMLATCLTQAREDDRDIFSESFDAVTEAAALPAGWKLQQREGSAEADVVKDGTTAALRIHWDKRATTCLLSPFVPVEPGATYRLTFRAKREGRVTYFVRPIAFAQEKWADSLELAKEPVRSDSWHAYALTFTVPADRHFVILQAWLVGEAGTAWLDDVTLSRNEPAEAVVDNDVRPVIALPPLTEDSQAPAPPQAAIPPKGYGVALHNGVPTVFHDGKPLFVQAFHNTTWSSKAAVGPLSRAMAEAGVHVHMLQTALDWGEEFASGGVGVYGTANNTLDKRIQAILQMDPEAHFLLNVHCFVPDTWYEKYPGEMVQAEDGTLVKFRPGARRGFNSWASAKWQDEVNRRIRSLIQHLRSRDYYSRIIGLQTFAGWEGQWTWPRPHADAYTDKSVLKRLNQLFADYSPAMVARFRGWARQHYADDVQRLRKAWGKPDVTFDTIAVPPLQVLEKVSSLGLKDPADPDTRYVRDYYLCFMDCRVEALLRFARTIKESTRDEPLLSGSYYGAILFAHIGGTLNVLRELHGYSQRFHQSPWLDYFTSPPHHYIHEVGGATVMHLLVDSMLAADKFVILENDIPTHLMQKRAHQFNPPAAIAKNTEESIAVIRRSFAYVLVKGLGVWWWDEEINQETGEPVWYAEKQLLDALGQTSTIGREALAWDRRPVSEVAVFYDELSNLYDKPVARGMGRDLIMEQLLPLLKIGAPVGIYALEDIATLPPQKLYIFWNALYLTPEQREAIQQTVRRNRATALWIYAPGLVSPTSLDVANVSATTGMTVRMENAQALMDTRLSNPNHPLSQPLFGQVVGSMRAPEFSQRRAEDKANNSYQTISGTVHTSDFRQREQTDRIGPQFWIEDPQATVLGRSLASGQPTLAIKEFSDWKSVYAAFYPLNTPLLREIARYAGVHIFDEQDDVIEANTSLLSLHTAEPGTRTLRLPHRADVIDLITGKTVATDTDTFEVTVNAPATLIYRLKAPTGE